MSRERSHTEYIQAYYRIFRALIAYIKEHFPNGLTWNNKDGIDALEALKEIQTGSRAVPTAGAGAPPPPPPPPPPLPLPAIDGTADSTSKSSAKGGDMSAVFDQLNQGSSVTAGLRKVDKSEMTHKNPSLRAGAAVPQRSDSQGSVSSSTSRGKSPVPSKKPKPESMRTKKPPRKELDGNKWIVENFDNTGSEVIEIEGQLSHSILISRCTKCVIKVTGKANAISIDNCTGLSILVDSLVSSLDVIKSPKFQVQVDGVVPTILLDQVDSATIYLSAESMTTEVFTSKSSSVNIVLLPKSETEGDDKECAIPEQIRSVVKNGTVVSEIVEHAG
jgi:adenylyl cyclase-associated protein